MERGMELYQVVYQVIVTQIEFGIYRFGDGLPTIEEASGQLSVSEDTIGTAYQRLRGDGYISLVKNAGAKVKVRYSEQAIKKNIQQYFARRKRAIMDLSQSIHLLFGHAQWLGLKRASPDMLDRLGRLSGKEAPAPYAMLPYLEQKYAGLGNKLLIQLIWQTYLFFHAPLFSVVTVGERETERYLTEATGFCRAKDWPALRARVKRSTDRLSELMLRFMEEEVDVEPEGGEVAFHWSAQSNRSQLCDSLSLELLLQIAYEVYPVGSFLPTAERLAREKGVSVSTARRALAMLGSIGAAKSTQRVGTVVLPFEAGSEYCDFTQRAIRRRLMGFVQSLQILALSCKAVAEETILEVDQEALEQWRGRLLEAKRIGRNEMAVSSSLEFLSRNSPHQAVRTVYSGLFRQLLWGHPLRLVRGSRQDLDAMFLKALEYLAGCLERRDAACFSAKLEELVVFQLEFVVNCLSQLGIGEVQAILIPEKDELG